MNWSKWNVFARFGFLAGGGLLLLVGSVSTILNLTWPEPATWVSGAVGLTLLGAGAVVAMLGVSQLKSAESRGINFGRYNVGLTFALFTLAVVTAVGTAGLVRGKAFDFHYKPSAGAAPRPEDTETPKPGSPTTNGSEPEKSEWKRMNERELRQVSSLLLFACATATLGAAFFVANELRDKRPGSFDTNLFWSGLWFRLGQAIIYSLVIFVMLWGYAQAPPETYKYLLVVGLLLGMFVKSGESLIAGLAERTLSAVAGLVARPGAPDQPAPTVPPAASPKTEKVRLAHLNAKAIERALNGKWLEAAQLELTQLAGQWRASPAEAPEDYRLSVPFKSDADATQAVGHMLVGRIAILPKPLRDAGLDPLVIDSVGDRLVVDVPEAALEGLAREARAGRWPSHGVV